MKKLHAYVDGFNLYRGMMDPKNNMPGAAFPPPVLRQFLWLNLDGYIRSFFSEEYSLDWIHYFTAPIKDNPKSLERQETYWKALESIPHLTIHLGVNARRYNKKREVIRYEEKQSDVRFALQALEDSFTLPELNSIVFVCADADQVPTIERIKVLKPDIELILIYPPLRHSGDLEKLVPNPYKTNYIPLRDNQFPDIVEYEREGNTITVSKPPEWD